MSTTKKTDTWNGAIMALCAIIYLALLILFGWQTWQFVVWLFPDDALLFRVLTFGSFDVLAAIWAGVHTFHKFRSRGAKTWVVIAWGFTFILSLIASVLYLVLLGYFRFHLDVTPTMVDIGYAVSIFALVFNILALMAFLILEYRGAHPRQDYYELEQPITIEEVEETLERAKQAGLTVRNLRALSANNGRVHTRTKTPP
jgi:hypothetical protein